MFHAREFRIVIMCSSERQQEIIDEFWIYVSAGVTLFTLSTCSSAPVLALLPFRVSCYFYDGQSFSRYRCRVPQGTEN
jgi:hypothetical protein